MAAVGQVPALRIRVGLRGKFIGATVQAAAVS